MRLHRSAFILLLWILALALAACQSKTPTPGLTPRVPTGAATSTVPTSTAAPAVTAAPTTPASKSLVVCEPVEPTSLYPYGGSSSSMWSILEAIYDGPFDTRGFSVQPVILAQIPSLAGGDAVFRPVTVQAGDGVVDSSGNLLSLKAGVRVLPAGCTSQECAVTWDGKSELKMDTLAVTFKLLAGLKWSDGAPLTAADSVYSFGLSADPATPVSKYRVDRTYSYKAIDDQTVEWTGLPGFVDQQFPTYFWMPLPQHAWGDQSAASLLTDQAATHSPLGWGPYILKEWVAGDHISLVKNPNYFRASEGLPHFDSLVFRFTGPVGDSNLAALRAGECDIVDQNPDFFNMIPNLLELEKRGALKTYVGQGPEWEHLDFGIQPADSAARPDWFGDARTRQAFAFCIDRQGIADALLYRRSSVPTTFLPAGHPLLADGLAEYPLTLRLA